MHGTRPAFCWLVIAVALEVLNVSVLRSALAAQAARDSANFGFMGMALIGWLIWRTQNLDTPGWCLDGLYLLMAFWNAGALAVVVAQAIVGQAWLWRGLTIEYATALGVVGVAPSALRSLRLLRRPVHAS